MTSKDSKLPVDAMGGSLGQRVGRDEATGNDVVSSAASTAALFPRALDITEKEWAAQVVELARALGWRRYHTYRSERSEPGWPDEALVRDRLLLLELKAERGKLSDAQKQWLRALRAAGVEALVARPSDLAELAVVLQARERRRSTLDVRTEKQIAA